jgi:glucosamine 6-phosphate synthetase-like amidotransferase/phosphosugar isomerase protein
MCGIAGIHVKGDVGTLNLDAMLTTMLEHIEHRGGDATGFVALTDEGVGRWQKAACGAKDFNLERRSVPRGTVTVLGHTRWATQGHHGFMENNHPIKRGPFFIIHNGHIHNDKEVFKKAKRNRFGLVDSECIAASLSEHGGLNLLHRVMEGLDGAAAVAAVDERNPREMALARGQSSPLFVLETKRLVLFASTERCVIAAHERHIGKIKKNAVTEIEEGTMIHLRAGRKTTVVRFKVPEVKKAWSWLDKEYDKDGFTKKPGAKYSGSIYTPTVSNGDKILEQFRKDQSKEMDYLECDVCQVAYSYQRMEWVQDNGETVCLCPVCYDWLNDQDPDADPIDANPLDVRFRV